MKRSALNEIQGVLVTANRSDLAEELVVAKKGPMQYMMNMDNPKLAINSFLADSLSAISCSFG